MSLFRGNRIASWALSVLALPLLVLAAACSGRVVSEEEQQEKTPATAKAAASCPMFGCTIGRNLANTTDKNIPGDWNIKKDDKKNVKWSVHLGSVAYGGPVIAGGRIFVGTNNEVPRDPAIKGDKGVMMCFRESDGKFLWQAVHDKLPNPDENDYGKTGIASVPAVDGSRLYYVSNRCELVCADVAGDEATGKAKFIWKLDMIKELDVYPCYLANSSPLVVGDLVFALTGNGVKPNTADVINPDAPSFVAVNKTTGKVVWKDNSPGKGILEGQWSSPAAAEVGGVMQVIYGGGDGWLRGFEAKTGKLLWKFDCNPKESEFKAGGKGDRNFITATPVVHDGKVYLAVGQDTESGPGMGHLWCVDITKEPKNKDRDLSPAVKAGDKPRSILDPKDPANKDSGLVWQYGGPAPANAGRDFVFGRTISTVAIHDGLVYAVDIDGFFHCVDAKTGAKYWEYDLKDGTWNSPYYVDGKVFIGTSSGDLYVFAHGKKQPEPKKIDMEQPLKVPPVAVNGVLYVNNGTSLYAIVGK